MSMKMPAACADNIMTPPVSLASPRRETRISRTDRPRRRHAACDESVVAKAVFVPYHASPASKNIHDISMT